MKYLIVYAHPNPQSFNHAIEEHIENRLIDAGKEFEIRDLYNLRFRPDLDEEDLSFLKQEQVSPGVQTEQEYVKYSDVLIFIYPIWWFGMPAILKGYIDRVFSSGFAFKYTEQGPEGLLTDKKVIIINTTGSTEDVYDSMGYKESLKRNIDKGIFEFCGMKIITHKYFYAVPFISDEERQRMLEEITEMKL